MSTPISKPTHQPSYSTRPTLRVDLPQIRANYDALKAKVGAAKIGASVKADAYGLGAVPVAKTLYGAGCRIFFVATAGEGKLLRDGVGPNAAIYVLNGPAPRDKGVLLGAKLKPVINSMEQAQFWGSVAREVKEPPYTAIHIDTGMNRLGLSMEDVTTLSRNKSLWKDLNPEWVMSHLACAPNTAGIYLGKPYHFQMVRPGIGLYGGVATTNPKQEVSKPAATLLAPILQVRYIKAGETLGYNGTYVAPRDMRIAVVGAGYADGIPVNESNRGTAILHDEEVKIVGRVSMDLTMIDATDAKLTVEVGGVVVFRGDHLEAEAKSAQTINYELLVRLGQRCRRDYWKPKKKDT